VSDDAKLQELVQFVHQQSVDLAKEIDSVLTSTDESEEDSLKRRLSVGTESGSRSKNDAMDPVKERLQLLLLDRKAQKDVIDSQKAELQVLRAAAKSARQGSSGRFVCFVSFFFVLFFLTCFF
jgi:hypothetical protein